MIFFRAACSILKSFILIKYNVQNINDIFKLKYISFIVENINDLMLYLLENVHFVKG